MESATNVRKVDGHRRKMLIRNGWVKQFATVNLRVNYHIHRYEVRSAEHNLFHGDRSRGKDSGCYRYVVATCVAANAGQEQCIIYHKTVLLIT